MGKYIKSILYLLFFIKHVRMDSLDNFLTVPELPMSTFVYWRNATIPFYIVPEHFDREQSNSIMTTLALFAFKTCVKFVPVMTAPVAGQHALVFANPEGIRKCVLDNTGHSLDEPHTVILGYDCLSSPHVDMMVMRALGFPFEHNRASRDLFINVLVENIDPSAIELFTKDTKLPLELRSLAYDIDSVMHFGERDYSKNGHKTIIFKDLLRNPVKQNRNGLSHLDLRKIELVYGPECRKRDRQEKIELCQNYPGVARRKREIEDATVTNLRVNRDITPAPTDVKPDLTDTLKNLGVVDEVQNVVEQVYKVSAKALKNARAKYCNVTSTGLREAEEKVVRNNTKPDVLGIIEVIAEYTQSMVDHALTNLTQFCASSENMETYQRARCPFYGGRDCPQTYRSTKSGAVRHSTQHRPIIFQSTKHEGSPYKYIGKHPLRVGNETKNATVVRRKREAPVEAPSNDTKSRRDDVTKVYRHRSRDEVKDENQDVQARRDSRRKREVEATTAQSRREDATGVIYHRSKDEVTTPAPVANVTDNKEAMRTGYPEIRDVPYVPEWPFPEKHRRINKLKKKLRPKPKQPHVSKESFEKKFVREDSMDVNSDKLESETTHKARPKATPRMKKKKAVHVRRERTTKPQRQRVPKIVRKPDQKDSPAPDTEDFPVEKLVEADAEDKIVDQLESAEEKPVLPPLTVPLSKANQEFYSERKWPDGVVRYVVKEHATYDNTAVRRRLDEVNAILKEKTCARIQEITEDEAKEHEDYLVIDTGADFVTGRVGGRQNFGCLELFSGGQHKQHAAMLVMAMLGFYFELARHDRDKYVRVHLRHVRPDKLHHFELIRDDATFPLPYDFESATHPAWQFWRKIGKSGISTVATFKSKDPDGSIMKSFGQHDKLLSELDLVKINSVYGTTCFRGRSQLPKEAARARSKDTYTSGEN